MEIENGEIYLHIPTKRKVRPVKYTCSPKYVFLHDLGIVKVKDLKLIKKEQKKLLQE